MDDVLKRNANNKLDGMNDLNHFCTEHNMTYLIYNDGSLCITEKSNKAWHGRIFKTKNGPKAEQYLYQESFRKQGLHEKLKTILDEIAEKNEMFFTSSSDAIAHEKTDIEQLIQDLKNELKQGDSRRTELFLDMILSNGDVLVELEEQFEAES